MNQNQWIIDYRKEKKLNHEQVAQLAGIDRTYYTKIENGATPSVKVAQKLADVLEFKWTIFFEDQCDKKSHTA